MRNQNAPAIASRAAPRCVPHPADAAAPAKADQNASKAASPNGADTKAPTQVRQKAAGPSLLEASSRESLIRARAYERYECNGCVDGNDVDDWLAAEAEVSAMLCRGEVPAAASSTE